MTPQDKDLKGFMIHHSSLPKIMVIETRNLSL